MTFLNEYIDRPAITMAATNRMSRDMDRDMNDARRFTEEDTNDPSAGRSATGHYSEQGHKLEEIKSMAKHSGRSVAIFFSGLFQTIIAIGTLGTSTRLSSARIEC